jgi:predicted transcriptional regulator
MPAFFFVSYINFLVYMLETLIYDSGITSRRSDTMRVYRATRKTSLKILSGLAKGTQVHTILTAIMKKPRTTKELLKTVSTKSSNPVAVVSWYVAHLKKVGAIEVVPTSSKLLRSA